MTLTDWIRSLGARWAAPRVDPPELAAVEREIEAAGWDAAWAAEVVRRAKSCEGQGVYGLGHGGKDPSALSPLDKAGLLDCSGFLAWSWSEPRHDPDDGEDEIGGDWIYTDALEADARGRQRFARRILPPDVRPGDGLVYGAGAKVGHCAIVVAVPAVARRFADVTVIHCHGPSGTGPAITRSSGALWDRKQGIAIRRVGR
jgi:cell wall-associated NlpC family hydrolase